MGLTRVQLAANIQANLGGSGVSFFTADEINDSIQDAYNEIAALTLYNVKRVTLKWIAGLNYYDFVNNPALNVTDYLGTIAVFNISTNQFLRDDVGMRDFDRLRRDWEWWRGAPMFWAPHSLRFTCIVPCYNGDGANSKLYSTIAIDDQTTVIPPFPVDYSCLVWRNGLLQNSSGDYTIVADQVVFNTLLIGGDVISVSTIHAQLPANLTFTLYYYAQSPTLTGDSDTFLLASDMDDLIEFYATADLLETAEEVTKAATYWTQYFDRIVLYRERCHNVAKFELLMKV